MGRQVPTKEQAKEFWEGYKIKPHRVYEQGEGWIWVYPPIDLNSLTKWAVTQLLEEYNIEFYSFKQNDKWYYSEVSIWRKGSTKHDFDVLHDELIAKHFEQGANLDEVTALALFWALDAVRQKEGL